MKSTFFEYTHTWLVFYYTVWLVHTLWVKSRLFDYKWFFFSNFYSFDKNHQQLWHLKWKTTL